MRINFVNLNLLLIIVVLVIVDGADGGCVPTRKIGIGKICPAAVDHLLEYVMNDAIDIY